MPQSPHQPMRERDWGKDVKREQRESMAGMGKEKGKGVGGDKRDAVYRTHTCRP